MSVSEGAWRARHSAGKKGVIAARGPANPVAVLYIAIFMGLVKASETRSLIEEVVVLAPRFD